MTHTPKQHTELHSPQGPSVMRGMVVEIVCLGENNLSHLCIFDDALVGVRTENWAHALVQPGGSHRFED